jgi:hypothetical protein
VFDQNLILLSRFQLLGCQTTAIAFNPVIPRFIYGVDGWDEHIVEEADTDFMRQSRQLAIDPPPDYYQNLNALVISGDGGWVYMLLAQTWNAPPSKLLAARIELGDINPPSSALNPLPATQTHDWWVVSWSGTDDISGINHYDVQYRAGDAGLWTNWLSTSSTQGLFWNATPGQTYYFRVRAIDHKGNSEAYPLDAETFTTAGSDLSGPNQIYLPLMNR